MNSYLLTFPVIQKVIVVLESEQCILFLSFRYVFRSAKKVGLQELGPRFTLKLRSLQKGTFDTKYGEYEFIHKVKMFLILTLPQMKTVELFSSITPDEAVFHLDLHFMFSSLCIL